MENDRRLTNRRKFLLNSASVSLVAVAAPSILRAQETGSGVNPTRRNISSFRVPDWRDHFDSLKNGVILSDTVSRMLQYWSEDESIYKLYPTSVPMTDELTKRGYTKIIRKVEGPSWSPTPAMRKRDPELPAYVGPGPENPLGTHALYLTWQYYRIHGTGDTRKIGRRSSSGCIGLYNEQIAELFALAKIGTQVKLI